ncbi:MAG: HesA/MoeB/ThiF family protein [Burkholderiaceae bacterium]
MNDDQLLRYSRHILLDDIGIEGQQRLNDAHAVVIGAGGLGSPAAIYLAASGLGTLTLIDDDVVDLTNLQRQILHGTPDVGLAKVASGANALRRLNPEVDVRTIAERVDQQRLAGIVATADVVVDCSDNFATRHAANRACVAASVPLVSGAAIRFDGQIASFDLRRVDDAAERAPCYACLFPESDEVEDVACSTMGVFAPLTGIVGAMQAAEAAKIIIGLPSLSGRLLLVDARTMEWQSIALSRDPCCAVCGVVLGID